MREIRQPLGVRLARDQRLQDGAATDPEDVRQPDRNLQVGGVQDLLDTLRVLHDLARQLLARTRQVPKILDRHRRHATAADQTVSQQTRQPQRVVHVAFPARHRLHFMGVGQGQLERALQDVPHRLPVTPGHLHHRVRHTARRQPLRQLQQTPGRGRKRPTLLVDAAGILKPDPGHHRVLPQVQTHAPLDQHMHRCLRAMASSALQSKARNRARGSTCSVIRRLHSRVAPAWLRRTAVHPRQHFGVLSRSGSNSLTGYSHQ